MQLPPAKDRKTYDARRQVDLLEAFIDEMDEMALEEQSLLAALCTAQTIVLHDPTPDNKAAVLLAKLNLEQLKVRIRARSKQKNTYQTIVRVIP